MPSLLSMPPRDAGSTSPSDAPSRPAGTIPAAFDIAVVSAPPSVEVARQATRAWVRCHGRIQAAQVDAVLIVVSELCTNAVLHGRREAIDVRGWVPAPGELRLEVHDRSPSAIPAPQRAGSDSESGRGLLLVDALVAELGGTWGFTEDGACAWCHLALACSFDLGAVSGGDLPALHGFVGRHLPVQHLQRLLPGHRAAPPAPGRRRGRHPLASASRALPDVIAPPGWADPTRPCQGSSEPGR